MKKIVIQLRQNEHWWSGTVADGFNMPYDISSKCTVNQMKNTTNNQVSPVLMSDCGRLLYNEDGIIYSFNNGELTAKGKNIVLKEVDGGLKEVFQFFKSQICPDEDLLPDKNLIIRQVQSIGKNNNFTKMVLQNQNGFKIEAVGFFEATELMKAYADKKKISCTYYPEINSFRGNEKLQINLIGYRIEGE